MKFIAHAAAVAALSASFVLAAQPAAKKPSKASDSKAATVIPTAERSKGTAYTTITGKDRQVYFESNAPLENIKGQSNQVTGYAVVSKDTAGKLTAGEWRLPVKSMKTGIDLRDEHLASSDWLNSEKFPDVVFKINETRDLKEVKKSDAFATYSTTLVGTLTLHGVSKSVSIPNATITLLKESAATAKVAKGDLVSIRSKFTVTLKDFGVSHPVIGEKVAKDVSLDVSLFLSQAPNE